MPDFEIQRAEGSQLAFLLSIPAGAGRKKPPLLCFLHGYDEGAPAPLATALRRHGPLAAGNPESVRKRFIVAAPQLPRKGDLWHEYAEAVRQLVREIQLRHAADPERRYLTGFSFGADGVFDLALARPGFWAALWPVDPTRVPVADPGLPVWLSSGEISRHGAPLFMSRLKLSDAGRGRPGGRVFEDRGQDHGGTARLAYGESRIYNWLLKHRL